MIICRFFAAEENRNISMCNILFCDVRSTFKNAHIPQMHKRDTKNILKKATYVLSVCLSVCLDCLTGRGEGQERVTIIFILFFARGNLGRQTNPKVGADRFEVVEDMDDFLLNR